MANNSIATAYVRILPDATGIVDSLEKDLGGASAKAGSSAGKKFGNAMTGAARTLAPLSAGVAAVAAGAVKVSTDFDASMSKVQAITGATGEDFDALREKALEMGGSTKFTVSEAADAMTYMGMAGWKTQQIIAGMPGILSLAAAGGSDLARTSDIVTDALTAFGRSAGDSGRLADIMAATITGANTDVEMLGETFKYAAAVGGSYGYTMEDVALATGLMATAGVKGSQAGTSLRSIMSRLATDAGASSKRLGALGTLTQQLGVAFYEADGTMRPFRDVIIDAQKAWKGLTKEEQAYAAKQIAGQNAMTGWMTLMSAAEEDVEALSSAIDGSSESIDGYNGVAEQMAAVMQDNLSGQLTELGSKLQLLAVQVIDTILPALRDAVDWLQKGVDWLSSLDEGTKKALITAAGVIAIAAPVLGAIGSITKGVTGIIGIVKGVPSVIGTVSGALGSIKGVITGLFSLIAAHPIIAVITAIVGGITWLWNTNEDFRNFITGVWNGIVDLFKGAWESIKSAWSGVVDFFGGIWDGIKKAFSSVRDWFSEKFEAAKNAVIDAFSVDWGQVGRNVIDGIIGGVSDFAGKLWNKVKGVAQGVVDTANAVFDSNSPSKVFYGIGGDVIHGLENGLVRNADDAINAMGNTAEAITRQGSAITMPSAAVTGRLDNSPSVYNLLEEYLPQLANLSIVMDNGVVAGQLSQPVDKHIGTAAYYVGRERFA